MEEVLPDQLAEGAWAGLETFAAAGGNLSSVHSVASFFLSRVDTEVDRRLVDRRLDDIGTGQARLLRSKAAVAQARLAYRFGSSVTSRPACGGTALPTAARTSRRRCHPRRRGPSQFP